MLNISVLIASVLLGAAAILVAVRIAIGPTLADRALALDLMGFLAVAFAAVFVLRTGQVSLFDPAMALALVAFLATVALARFSLRMIGGEEALSGRNRVRDSGRDGQRSGRDDGNCHD